MAPSVEPVVRAPFTGPSIGSRSRGMKLLKAALFVVSLNASANVVATPSYWNFGDVPPGQSAMVTIQFINTSAAPIPSFTASCSGDFSAFSCFSSCYSLPAHGSCAVQVRFIPRNGDGLTRTLWVNGFGGGSYSSATVVGTEAKMRD